MNNQQQPFFYPSGGEDGNGGVAQQQHQQQQQQQPLAVADDQQDDEFLFASGSLLALPDDYIGLDIPNNNNNIINNIHNNHNNGFVNNNNNNNNNNNQNDDDDDDDPPINMNMISTITQTGETILAREMAKLTMKEHEAILHDIHGVSNDEHIINETTDFVTTKLQELQIEIDKQLLGLTHTNNTNQQQQQQQQDNVSVGDESSSHNSRRSPTAAAPVGSAYTMATQISLEYVTNRSFRIMFLRSCYYDVPKTATKIHWTF